MTFIWATKGTWAGLCNREDIAYEQSSQKNIQLAVKTGAGPGGLASFVIGHRAQHSGSEHTRRRTSRLRTGSAAAEVRLKGIRRLIWD